ncbi:homeobox protein knotted-1-like 11 [Triticum aestivum]|uniref:homeobox protein knotted-1-like 11 n=1 Tax=Triticum aestivum TaxID=4565 RepID=UPI001D00FA97|nr:homeobox protein knotted-1-like 11 [Triticum aestivum]
MAYQYHHQDHTAAALGMDPAAAAGNPGGGFAPGLGAGAPGGWEREKAAIEAHPLYERLLEAHVACLRVATPVDQLPRIDAQIAACAPPPMTPAAAPSGGEELDLFMVSCYYEASSPHAGRVRTPRVGWAGLLRACCSMCRLTRRACVCGSKKSGLDGIRR